MFSDPVNWIDPDGLKVEVISRKLEINLVGGIGAHTIVRVTPSGGTPITIASHNVGGLNLVVFGHPSDANLYPDTKNKVLIAPPNGLTEEQFDVLVLVEAAKMQKAQSNEVYSALLQGGGLNCHATTQRLIDGVGGKIPKNFNPSGLNPGLGN